MRRTYHSDRPSGDLMTDVYEALIHHGSHSREYRRAYMRWYRTTRPELRQAELERLMAYRATA